MTSEDLPEEVENTEADFDFTDLQQAQGPQEIEIPGVGKAVAELVDYGYIEEYRKRNRVRQSEGRAEQTEEEEVDLTPGQMAEILSDRYVSPNFDLTAEDVKSMKPEYPALLLGELMGDGVDVERNPDGTVNVSGAGNAE